MPGNSSQGMSQLRRKDGSFSGCFCCFLFFVAFPPLGLLPFPSSDAHGCTHQSGCSALSMSVPLLSQNSSGFTVLTLHY